MLSTSIGFITIASTGNEIDFGDLAAGTSGILSTGNSKRAIWAGGYTPTLLNVIQYVQIPNGGTAVDFGDLTQARQGGSGSSQAHGGLNDGYQGTRVRPIPTGIGVGQRGLITLGTQNDGVVHQITVNTLGNSSDFGNLGVAKSVGGSMTGSSTRAVEHVGSTPSQVNTIEYTSFATTGNFADFGDQTKASVYMVGASNDTRGISGGGESPSALNTLDYITHATLGNSTDFGDATSTISAGGKGIAGSSTRGVYITGSNPNLSAIDFITIGSTGNATDFGDTSTVHTFGGSLSSSTRACFSGNSSVSPGTSDVIDYVTISSAGNATDFGDLTSARYDNPGLSNNIRGVFAGGNPGSALVLDYITIASTGDAADFGDVTACAAGSALCNGYGGLS